MEAQSGRMQPEKIQALKNAIHEHLRSQNTYTQIRTFLAKYLKEENISSGDNQEKLLQMLQEKGVVDEILKSLGRPEDLVKGSAGGAAWAYGRMYSDKPVPISPSKRYLHVKMLGGKAFLEHLSSNTDGGPASLMVHVLFQQQRFRSRPASCGVEPDFDDAFLLELKPDETGSPSDLNTLLKLNEPIYVNVVRHDSDGSTTLIGTHRLDEWRKVLHTGYLSLSVELAGVGNDSKVPVGVLELRMELLPHPAGQGLPQDDIDKVLQKELSGESEEDRRFYVYAKQWWKDYLQIRDTHHSRLIKIFAQNESGVNRPVCSFVQPLRAGRLLDTPYHAARFVSLLGYERQEAVGGGRAETWNSTYTLLTTGKGDCEEHSLLLCCLLLGFGLDAYVCVGTDEEGAHVWVVTISPKRDKIVFWESVNGQRQSWTKGQKDPVHSHPNGRKMTYKTADCLFNHRRFYANIQRSTDVSMCSFDVDDDKYWKAMSENSLKGPKKQPVAALSASTIPAVQTEEALEASLRSLISEYRKSLDLNVAWDEELSYLLTPALAAYEMERITAVAVGNEEFQHSIKRAVPEGHTFKGFPIQFAHRNTVRMMEALKRAKVGADVLQARGDFCKMGIRVRVFTYPDDVCAVWVMLAVKYKSTA